MILSMNYQGIVFLISLLTGLIGGGIYGLICIFRKYVSHNIIGIYIEDLIFWIVYGICAFLTMLYYNNGEIRPFVILGILLGLILYGIFMHKIILVLLSPVIKVLRLFAEIISTPFRIVLFPVKKILIIFKKHLKNTVKYEKINKLLLKLTKRR